MSTSATPRKAAASLPSLEASSSTSTACMRRRSSSAGVALAPALAPAVAPAAAKPKEEAVFSGPRRGSAQGRRQQVCYQSPYTLRQ
jgi:hypothetical protein